MNFLVIRILFSGHVKFTKPNICGRNCRRTSIIIERCVWCSCVKKMFYNCKCWKLKFTACSWIKKKKQVFYSTHFFIVVKIWLAVPDYLNRLYRLNEISINYSLWHNWHCDLLIELLAPWQKNSLPRIVKCKTWNSLNFIRINVLQTSLSLVW